jgi:hypothetical protein
VSERVSARERHTHTDTHLVTKLKQQSPSRPNKKLLMLSCRTTSSVPTSTRAALLPLLSLPLLLLLLLLLLWAQTRPRVPTREAEKLDTPAPRACALPTECATALRR